MMPIQPQQVRTLCGMPKHFKAGNASHLATYWRSRERIRSQWMRGFTKLVKKQFTKEQARMVAALNGAGMDNPKPAITRVLDKGTPEWAKLYRGLYMGMAQDIVPLVLAQFDTPKHAAPYSIKGDDDEWMTWMLAYIDDVTPDKIKGLNRTTRDSILDTITRGVAAGDGTPDIVARINQLYSDSITPLRSMTIARTEITASSNAATHQTGEYLADKYELEIMKKWLTARDNRVRDSHQDMENHPEIGLDELFDVNGSAMLHPGDGTNGADLAEIVNCRCDVVQRVP